MAMLDELPITGANIIEGLDRLSGPATIASSDPRTGNVWQTRFHDATQEEVGAACQAAARAFDSLRDYLPKRLRHLLMAIAAELDEHSDVLVPVAELETGLDRGWLGRELKRTSFQARAFAALLEDGQYVRATIDTRDPNYPPGPRPDLRRMLVGVGPVVVFEASNMPLAFGVAGGDTVAAFAAGCPVIVKAHPTHPATSELVGRFVASAIARVGAPRGTLSFLHGGPAVCAGLITHPLVRAGAFTGSLHAGRALWDLAVSRPEPVPLYAEMGSVNPVFVTEAALNARGARIAEELVASALLNSGQLCTKPGLVVLPDSAAGEVFIRAIAGRLDASTRGVLLNSQLRDLLGDQVAFMEAHEDVSLVARTGAGDSAGVSATATLFRTTAVSLLADMQLSEEHFGPTCLLVTCKSSDEMLRLARQLRGQLTATIHAETADRDMVAPILHALRERAGRLIWNAFPTGVAVTSAMHHGGPFPASTLPAYSSVGMSSIARFLRPVAFQEFPDAQLPPALQDANPLGIRRMVNGAWTTGPAGRVV